MINEMNSIDGVDESYRPKCEDTCTGVKTKKRPVNPITGHPRPDIKTASVYQGPICKVVERVNSFHVNHN